MHNSLNLQLVKLQLLIISIMFISAALYFAATLWFYEYALQSTACFKAYMLKLNRIKAVLPKLTWYWVQPTTKMGSIKQELTASPEALPNSSSSTATTSRTMDQTTSTTSSSNHATAKMHWGSIWVAAIIMFIVSLQFSIYFSSLWPYMSLIDPTVDQTFYGFTLASFSFGIVITAPCFGYWNNRLKLVRPIVTIGVFFSILGNLVYAFTEASDVNRKWIILCGRFLGGIGAGIIGTLRGYVATASTPEHRARAIAVGTTAISLGITAGPVVQACTTPIGYPGLVINQFHFSQYTAPAFISVVAALILLVLLYTMFRENSIGVDERKKEGKPGLKEFSIRKRLRCLHLDPFHFVPKYDKAAAILCIICWFAMWFSVTNMETVELPYTMAIFNWNNNDAVFYNSVIMACSSAITVVLFVILAYVSNRINERVCVTIGLLVLMGFYIGSFPWWFYTGHLTFKSGKETRLFLKQGGLDLHQTGHLSAYIILVNLAPPTTPHSVSTVSSFQQSTLAPNSTGTTPAYINVGCDLHMTWCNYTPKIPILSYLISYPLLSAGHPLVNVPISTLFSKILGPRRQGFMQSLMITAGSSARLTGPILISFLFDKYGPRIAWTMSVCVLSIPIFSSLIFYHRLVPLNMRPKMQTGDKLHYDGGILYHF